MVLYLDSNVFIYPLLYNDARAKNAVDILRKIIIGESSGITSSLALDEVVWILLKETKNRDLAIQETFRILSFSNLTISPVDSSLMIDALHFMKKYPSLKPRDAIHVASAVRSHASTIITDDSDFDIVKEIKRMSL